MNGVSPGNKLVDDWREVVILGDSVLGWDVDWYPAVTSGSVTLIYLLVWYMDLSLLTLISLLGLFITLADYLGPRVLDKIFTDWTPDKDKKLEKSIKSLTFVSRLTNGLISSFLSLRTSNPMTHFTIVCTTLLTTAYIGSLVSGLLLSYLAVMVLLMIPGLHRRGLLDKYCSSLTDKVKEMVKRKKLE